MKTPSAPRPLTLPAPETLAECIELCGGRPFLSKLCRQHGFKFYSNHWANWARANRIPAHWSQQISFVIEKEKVYFRDIEYLQTFFKIKNNRKRDNVSPDYPNPHIVRAFKDRWGSYENFFRYMWSVYKIKIHRNKFFNWLDLGFVEPGHIRELLKTKFNFTFRELGEPFAKPEVPFIEGEMAGVELKGAKLDDAMSEIERRREKWRVAQQKSRLARIERAQADLDAMYGKPVDQKTISAMLEDAE